MPVQRGRLCGLRGGDGSRPTVRYSRRRPRSPRSSASRSGTSRSATDRPPPPVRALRRRQRGPSGFPWERYTERSPDASWSALLTDHADLGGRRQRSATRDHRLNQTAHRHRDVPLGHRSSARRRDGHPTADSRPGSAPGVLGRPPHPRHRADVRAAHAPAVSRRSACGRMRWVHRAHRLRGRAPSVRSIDPAHRGRSFEVARQRGNRRPARLVAAVEVLEPPAVGPPPRVPPPGGPPVRAAPRRARPSPARGRPGGSCARSGCRGGSCPAR